MDSEFQRNETQNQINLIGLRIKKNSYWLYNLNPINFGTCEELSHQRTLSEKSLATDNSPWFVVKYHQESLGYKITEGDFIKLGRMKLKVYEINIPGRTVKTNGEKNQKKSRIINKSVVTVKKCQYLEETMEKDEEKGPKASAELSKNQIFIEERSSSISCRICLSDTFENDNPMIHPCKCSGTMKHVHMKCLQYWLNGKIQIKKHNNNCTTYSWKNFQCELCKNELECNFLNSFF